MSDLKRFINNWDYYYFWENIPVHISGISLNKSSISLTSVWQTYQLTATITPTWYVESGAINWSSSNTSIATVSNTWLVTCVTPWTCTITATTVFGGYSDTCEVLNARLPLEYQEVEYIQSSWTQYIDTGISANQYLSYEADFQAVWTTNDTQLFWARTGATSARFWLMVFSGIFHMMVGNSGTFNVTVDTNRHKCSVFLNNWNFTSSWDWASADSGSVGTSVYVNQNFRLFGMNYTGGNCPMKLYSFKLYTWSSTLVRNFVPCYRKADTVIWLYDLANNTFYTNSWTWTFTKWWNV